MTKKDKGESCLNLNLENVVKKMDMMKMEIVKIIEEEIVRGNMMIMSELKMMQETWEEEKLIMKEEIRLLKEKVNMLENKENNRETKEKNERRKNIIISGNIMNNSRDVDNCKVRVEKIIQDVIKTKVEITNTELICKNNKGKDVIRVRLATHDKKLEIMKKKSQLRGSDVFIDDDLTKEEQIIQKCIRERVKQEKENGKMAKVGYQKIFMNGKWCKWSSEVGKVFEELPTERVRT